MSGVEAEIQQKFEQRIHQARLDVDQVRENLEADIERVGADAIADDPDVFASVCVKLTNEMQAINTKWAELQRDVLSMLPKSRPEVTAKGVTKGNLHDELVIRTDEGKCYMRLIEHVPSCRLDLDEYSQRRQAVEYRFNQVQGKGSEGRRPSL
jgi:hypothetical protein